MPRYQQYPSVADTPSRKQRKSKRKSTFLFNKAQAAVERKERREVKKANALSPI